MEFTEPYRVESFNLLPSLQESNDAFHARNGKVAVKSDFHDLFIRHNVAHLFGLALVHRHFALKTTELLVDVDGTSTAWDLPDAPEAPGSTQYKKHHGRIRPLSWTVNGDWLMPYEFYFDSDFLLHEGVEFEGLRTMNPQFLQEFTHLLHLHSLNGVLGLRLLKDSHHRRVEIAEGEANITFEVSNDFASSTTSEYIEAAWAYHKSPPEDNNSSGEPIPMDWCVQFCYSPGKRTHFGVHVRIVLLLCLNSIL